MQQGRKLSNLISSCGLMSHVCMRWCGWPTGAWPKHAEQTALILASFRGGWPTCTIK